MQHLSRALFAMLIALTACSEPVGQFSTGWIGVDEAPAPVDPQVLVVPLPPQPVYLEPLPPPVCHMIRIATVPVGATALREVQSAEVDVEIQGGARGSRAIRTVFISPLGAAWEQQRATIELQPDGRALAHFSLPVASTFIEDHHLAGAWRVTTLDEGVEQASATFELRE